MNTRNKEDIPTRNFKKKKKQQEHHNWRQTTFHMEQKQTNKKKKKKKRITTTKKTKKNPSETPRKIFKCSRRTNFWKTNGRGISLSKTLSFNTFSLPNLQNKVTFLKLSLNLLLFRFLSPHGLSLPLPH